MDRQRISYYGRQGYNFAVLPLLLEPKEKLAQLTPEQLAQRLSHLTLFSHSYGSIAVQNIADVMKLELENLGWDAGMIAATMNELVSISVAPIARLDYPQPNFRQYAFTSGNDVTAIDSIRASNPDPVDHIPLLRACGYSRAADVLERHGKPIPRAMLLDEIKRDILQTRRVRNGTPLPRLEVYPSGYHIRSLLPDNEIRWMEERPDGSEVCRQLNEEEARRTQVSVVHDYRTYLHGDHKLGDLLINVANNAVQRGVGVGDGSALLQTSEHTLHQHAQKYARHARAHAQVSERGIA